MESLEQQAGTRARITRADGKAQKACRKRLVVSVEITDELTRLLQSIVDNKK